MAPSSLSAGVEALRRAVAALSGRMALEYGDLVPAASIERTSMLVAKLERLSGVPEPDRERAVAESIEVEDLATLDSWMRVADSPTLHDDEAEARARAEIGAQLRAVRELIAPHARALTDDVRGT